MKEQIASRILRDITNVQSTSKETPTVQLKRERGTPITVLIPNKKARLDLENPPLVDVNVLKQLQTENGENFSQVQRTKKILKGANVKVKRGSMTELKNESHALDRFFPVDDSLLDVGKNHGKKYVPVVYCSNLNGLVSFLIQKREMNDDDFLCKIGIDGGGGSFKVCVPSMIEVILLF